MANHTITVINKSGGGSGNGGGTKPNGKTNQKDKMEKIENKKRVNGVRLIRNIIRMNPIAMLPALALTMEVAQRTINMTTNILEAKTGNAMRYGNIRATASILTNPFGALKKTIWDGLIIQPMVIARQNETLNYDRQLTGNVIYSGNKQKGVF